MMNDEAPKLKNLAEENTTNASHFSWLESLKVGLRTTSRFHMLTRFTKAMKMNIF